MVVVDEAKGVGGGAGALKEKDGAADAGAGVPW